MPITVLNHPLAAHLLNTLRDVRTTPSEFRHVAHTLSTLLFWHATQNVSTATRSINTPLEPFSASFLGSGIAVVPVLRAGLSMLEAAVALFPDVSVGYVGLERSEETAVARSYYSKLPKLDGRFTICCDPMLATGGSASQALTLLKESGAGEMAFVSVIAAPEGVARLEADHPDVPIFTAALDRELNAKKYICPGLGDFGDRLYGTM